ncbi:PREDICTED: mucin-13 [Nipponia nippon]|nr:PREDICTED: mucin-13 [Nipponia nippon]
MPQTSRGESQEGYKTAIGGKELNVRVREKDYEGKHNTNEARRLGRAQRKQRENTYCLTYDENPNNYRKQRENTYCLTYDENLNNYRKQRENIYCLTYDENPNNYKKQRENTYCLTYDENPNNYRKQRENTYCLTYDENPNNYRNDHSIIFSNNYITGDLCKPGTCGTSFAKCVALHSTHTCVCQYGFYHNNSDCHRGQIFPGIITLNQFYSDSVQTVTSVQYQEVFQNITGFVIASYCAVFNCDTQTTECEEDIVPTCKCKQNFSKTEWDVRSCSDCSKDCSAEENKYCAKENGTPKCKCMPNFEEKNTKCVPCPVGYSGDNCKNNSELILIIVGTVFGAIILSLVIAVSVVSVRAKHKQDPEKTKLIKSGYSNPNTSDRQTTMFPRVQTTSGHANPGYQPNNPYEMHSSNRAHFSDRDYDDLYEMSREPQGFRLQSRY